MLNSIFEAKHVYLVGIKGVAMTSLALCLKDLGITVTGSDLAEDFVTQDLLTKAKFKVNIGFSRDHIIGQVDYLVYTGAHNGIHNIEVQQAQNLGIPVVSQAAALGELMANKKCISVCGTGGKSTTAAMIAWILESAGLRPSFSIGVGNINNLGTSGRFVSDSEWFVAEADEYAVDPTNDLRPRYSYQNPQVIVCTNLTYDHPDVYPTFDAMKVAFLDFFIKNNSTVLVNGDSDSLHKILDTIRLTSKNSQKTYLIGRKPDNDVVIKTLTQNGLNTTSQISGKSIANPLEMSLSVPGNHNGINATLALMVSSLCGVDTPTAVEALGLFKGTMRRFGYKGIYNGFMCFDDYAHTPEEINFTLQALQDAYTDYKIIVVFQPHTYSRTKALYQKFLQCFDRADELILVDIFASARESVDTDISSEDLARGIREHNKHISVVNLKTIRAVADSLLKQEKDHTILITMGAGNIYKLYEHIQPSL